MRPQRSTATKGRDRPLVEVVEVVEVVEGTPVDDSFFGLMLGPPTGGAWSAVATGNRIAAGVDSFRLDWIVPVTRPASSATFQRRSEAAGSRRWPRVASHAIPKSTVLWIRYVSSHASRLEARVVIWSPREGRSFRRARSIRGSWRCHPGSRLRPRADAGPGR